MARLVVSGILLVMFALTACSSGPSSAPIKPQMSEMSPPSASGGVAGIPESMVRDATHYGSTTGTAPGIESSGEGAHASATTNQMQFGRRMVILNAKLVIEVDSVDGAEAQLRGLVYQVGGYVLRGNTTGEGENKISYIVLRVPYQDLERVLTSAEGLARRVISRSSSSEDVTEQFVDLEARLRNLEATRDRIIALLARADTVEETLRVNQTLTEVQGQIEQIKGRMRYLEQSTAFSTIEVELRPVPPAPKPPAPLDLGKVFNEQLALLVGFVQFVIVFLIIIGVWTPVWIIPVLLMFWFRHRQPRRMHQSGSQQVP
ncbi:MAG: DUF4349 domain-containing protein [Chloroflexus sp.]